MGRETETDKVWSMIRRMNTIIREYGHPVLNDGEVTAVKNEEKAHMMVKTFGLIKFYLISLISIHGRNGFNTVGCPVD